MRDYLNAMYSYLLDIDLYYRGRDEEVIDIVKELKKALDKYSTSPDREKLNEIEKVFKRFYEEGQLREKFMVVQNQINNFGEMIFRTKKKFTVGE